MCDITALRGHLHPFSHPQSNICVEDVEVESGKVGPKPAPDTLGRRMVIRKECIRT